MRKPVLPTARLPAILSAHIRARSTHFPRNDLERAALSQAHLVDKALWQDVASLNQVVGAADVVLFYELYSAIKMGG